MNLTFPQLLIGTAGAILLYAAIKDQSPVDVIKNALNGKTGSKTDGGESSDSTVTVGKILPNAPANGGSGGDGGSGSFAVNTGGAVKNLAGEGVASTIPLASSVWKSSKMGKS